MNLSELKNILPSIEELQFQLPDGTFVPAHFHITEVGVITRDFIDCGGTVRHEKAINFQLWEANDYDHRLESEKLMKIINVAEKTLGLPDTRIEVEYQSHSISKYNLAFNGTHFTLESTQTDCLAKDNCGVPMSKPKIRMSELIAQQNSCEPGSGCC